MNCRNAKTKKSFHRFVEALCCQQANRKNVSLLYYSGITGNKGCISTPFPQQLPVREV